MFVVRLLWYTSINIKKALTILVRAFFILFRQRLIFQYKTKFHTTKHLFFKAPEKFELTK